MELIWILELKARESYFSLLNEALWKNYSQCRKIEPDLPEMSESEVTNRCLSVEYRIFSSTKVITIYRRNMALLTSQVKKDTDKFHLHAELTAPADPSPPPPPPPGHDPSAAAQPAEEKCAEEQQCASSGFVKASLVAPAKEKADRATPDCSGGPKKRISRLFGDESPPVSVNKTYSAPKPKLVVDCTFKSTLEEMKASGANDGKRKRGSTSKTSSFSSSKRSLERQTSLDTFLVSKKKRIEAEPAQSPPTEASPPDGASDRVQLGECDNRLETGDATGTQPQDALQVKVEKSDEILPESSIRVKVERPAETEPETSENAQSEASGKPEKPPGIESEKPNASPMKNADEPKPEKPFKIKLEKSDQLKSEDSSRFQISQRSDRAKPNKLSSSKTGKPEPVKADKSASSKGRKSAVIDQASKKRIADLVIHCLMPHYKANQIASRDLFKSLARNLSHRILDLPNPITGAQPQLIQPWFTSYLFVDSFICFYLSFSQHANGIRR